jgi:hypothetical protein
MAVAFDKFARAQDMIIAQGRCVRQVAQSDVNELVEVTKSILCLAAGNICVEPADGYFNAAGAANVGGVIFTVAVGDEFDLIRVKKIYDTGTTLTDAQMLAIS